MLKRKKEKKPSQPSLKRRLIVQPLVINLITLLLSFIVLIAIGARMDAGGLYTDEKITDVIAKALVRTNDGGLAITETPDLAELRAAAPDLWFVAKDDAGHKVSSGQMPAQFDSVVSALGDLSYAIFRDRSPPYSLSAVVRRESSSEGKVTILAHGKLIGLTFAVVVASNLIVLPIILIFAVVSLINTPWIVRRTLSGVARIAKEAEQIDVDQRGIRLSEHEVPREIGPLVRAVNEALARLDEGYERQQRFIASAAHELRTPIAILRAKIDAAPGSDGQHLSGEVARLATLAEQLLDLQRLDLQPPRVRIDLAGLVRGVAADMAPLMIASGKTIAVQVEAGGSVAGDAGALERVVTNLVQNAAEHGGQHVAVRVHGTTIDVEDDGPGIPVQERERVFEPFHRLRPRPTGTGLGLSLVLQAVERHGGSVSILDVPAGGTVFRVALPAA